MMSASSSLFPASPLRTLYFVRHGQSLANAGGVTMPNAEIPLTDLGQRHAYTDGAVP